MKKILFLGTTTGVIGTIAAMAAYLAIYRHGFSEGYEWGKKEQPFSWL